MSLLVVFNALRLLKTGAPPKGCFQPKAKIGILREENLWGGFDASSRPKGTDENEIVGCTDGA